MTAKAFPPVFFREIMKMIHRALRVIRQFHDIKQTDLADQLQISKSYLSEIESGKKAISMELLEKYSKVFDIPVSSLVFFSENIKSKTIPEKFRSAFAGKIITIMEWLTAQNESKEIKA
jgi:transcriptional regulator with XRE-family HTH domain